MATNFRSQYGPWAVVAGASEGLGAEFARQLAVRGLNLVLVARRAQVLQALSAELSAAHGVEVRCLPLDLSSPDAVKQIVEQADGSEVGLLVYNAALSAIGPFLETALEEHLKEIETNCRTPLALAHAFGQKMILRKRGGIVLMSSLSALQGTALIANYTATKAYNLILAEGLWEELRGQGIDVLASLPSAVSTPGYLASTNSRSVPADTPESVVTATLGALGKGPSVVPSLSGKFGAFVMQHLLPRKTAVTLMGRVLRGMYAH